MNEGTKQENTQQKHRKSSLSMSDNIRLVKFIEAEHKNQNKGDYEFAKLATETLGFNVTGAMVQKRRAALGIPATKEIIYEQIQKQKAERAAEAARKRMERLEQQERQKKLPLETPAETQEQSPQHANPIINRIRTLESQVLNLTVQLQNLQQKYDARFLTLPVRTL